MKKYFVNTRKGSRKFWTVNLSNSTMVISFGKIGTAGRVLEKKFDSNVKARHTLDKLIKEKLQKGYVPSKLDPAEAKKAKSAYSPMRVDNFWALIDSSLRYKNLQRQAAYLLKELKVLDEKDLVLFENIFNTLNNKAYRWDLWAAAYTIHSGCSDDGFADFRGWLITRGKSVYEKALDTTDSLVVLGKHSLTQSRYGDCLLYQASTVYEDLFDSDISSSEFAKRVKMKARPSGREWKEGDSAALQKLNPLLFSLFHKRKK